MDLSQISAALNSSYDRLVNLSNTISNGVDRAYNRAFNQLAVLPYRVHDYVSGPFSRSVEEVKILCPHSSPLENSAVVRHLVSFAARGVNISQINMPDFARIGLADKKSQSECSQTYGEMPSIGRYSWGQQFNGLEDEFSDITENYTTYGHTPYYDPEAPLPDYLNLCKSDNERLENQQTSGKSMPYCKARFPSFSTEKHIQITNRPQGGLDYLESLDNSEDNSEGRLTISGKCSSDEGTIKCEFTANRLETHFDVVERDGELLLSGSVRNRHIPKNAPLRFDSADVMMSYVRGESTIYHYALPILGLLGGYFLYKGLKSLFGNHTVKPVRLIPEEGALISSAQRSYKTV